MRKAPSPGLVGRETDPANEIRETWVGAQRVVNGNDLYSEEIGGTFFDCSLQLREGQVFVSKTGVNNRGVQRADMFAFCADLHFTQDLSSAGLVSCECVCFP